jgi:hypothetical protein
MNHLDSWRRRTSSQTKPFGASTSAGARLSIEQERDHDEMVLRFNEFKRKLHVHRTNSAGLSYTLEINHFANGKLLPRGGIDCLSR